MFVSIAIIYPPCNKHSPWKSMVGRWHFLVGPGLFSGAMYGNVSCTECNSTKTMRCSMHCWLFNFHVTLTRDVKVKIPSMKDLSGQLNCNNNNNNNNNNNRLVEDRNVCVLFVGVGTGPFLMACICLRAGYVHVFLSGFFQVIWRCFFDVSGSRLWLSFQGINCT